jgi:hypothetical protein
VFSAHGQPGGPPRGGGGGGGGGGLEFSGDFVRQE